MPVFLNTLGITTCPPIIMIPSITTMSSQNTQYVLMSCGIWSLISGQPMMLHPFIHCKWSSCEVAFCSCCIDMHSGMFAAVCMVSTFTFMPGICASLFSLWLCLESQSVMNRLRSGLYNIMTLIYPENSLFSLWQCCNIFSEYCYKWFMICYYTYLPGKAVVAESLETMKYT